MPGRGVCAAILAMIGIKLYAEKSRVCFFLFMYSVLALAGAALIVQSIARNEESSNAAGFMLISGAGMAIMTLVKSRRPQGEVHEDFLTMNQSRTAQLVRYRKIATVSHPDKNRIVVALREDAGRKDVTIWLNDRCRGR